MEHTFSVHVAKDGVESGNNLVLGLLAGGVAAAIGALVWMGITVATGFHIGYVAIGIGAWVGVAIRYFGNGTRVIFGVIGALFTLLSCVGGELLAVVQLSTSPQHNFISVLTTLSLGQTLVSIVSATSPIMYVIYAIGVFEGYKLSIRK